MRFFKPIFGPNRIYLDYASSTPVDFSMVKSFLKIPSAVLSANPSALHKEGVALKRYLEDARLVAARAIGAHADEIIYTSGATESDNLAIVGAAKAFLNDGLQPSEIAVFASDIEHAAVMEAMKMLASSGAHDGSLPTINGIVDPGHIILPEGAKALIVSVMYVNNEIGTVQPIAAIAKRLRYLKKHNPELRVVFHVDATQAPLYFSLSVAKLGIDMMTLGATKLYCPKGVGLLYKKRNVIITPLLHGGGQEFGMRPGTEAIQLIHDFSYALSYAQQQMENDRTKILDLQQYFESLVQEIPGVVVTCKDQERTPHITHVAIPNFDSELVVLELDARGIAASAKSACKNEEGNESEIVEKLYGKNVGAVRFSFGRMTTKRELERAARALKAVLEKYRK